ncbi:glycine cleavage system protein GcvH [Candidatus Marithioploca araucensis]|uniref:Glycine cleavage system H protein n=1 Tax=Candidatus Marithioploca araucensis TaxID=70273 RepID=A0ABT7VT00_9GAMM|nr:glycine cleavage system protein GcvH [Thiotrichales bacterium HSG14]MDM8562690.1 glycine cleavage system protein GcvH [Candidatus Marithioploca araucensis]
MSEIPEDLKYSESHEWVRLEEDGIVTIGITDHAQEALGDLVFVELPNKGNILNTEDACGVVESVKAASDIFSPITGEVIEVNLTVPDAPELVNESPYGKGWLFKLKPTENSDLDKLLAYDGYERFLEAEE